MFPVNKCVILTIHTGLVASSAIYPLSAIGSVSLAHMNRYLTTITGVHLNYDMIVPKDVPVANRDNSSK